ncbi:MAG TPA: choice-of-anchor tandem repeat GloVer-containing protein [Anaeromyxobacteraceae bacterium]|nr:choice-of-anchor tandem repeat GloVer-containing protein [Anaeromyxobacteraceae bacterium]
MAVAILAPGHARAAVNGTVRTLVSFDLTTGTNPSGSLIADANGNLFGTTSASSVLNAGTVFEIKKIGNGYANTPTVLVSLELANGGTPTGSLIADANGNLFGMTAGTALAEAGAVFEISKDPSTATGYANTPTVLVSFDGINGRDPNGSLLADAEGNLFGMTEEGGANLFGAVFEIRKDPSTATGYANTPTVLFNFDGAHGAVPVFGSLIADAYGDLFGVTSGGGASDLGTVFEIRKDPSTSTGYASTPIVLVSFDGTNGAGPVGGLIADANGNLFGTAGTGGASDLGTAFEIHKDPSTSTGYANAPIVLAGFDGTNGSDPGASLIADASGNLFGTTFLGGAQGFGTVFEITGSGYAICPDGGLFVDGRCATCPPGGMGP